MDAKGFEHECLTRDSSIRVFNSHYINIKELLRDLRIYKRSTYGL